VAVSLGHGQRAVPHKLLDRIQIDTLLDQP